MCDLLDAICQRLRKFEYVLRVNATGIVRGSCYHY